MSFRFLGTGSYVPPLIVTNHDLETFLDTSDEWIKQRVGVEERHICVDETVEDLAFFAAVRAMEQAGITAKELDMILCATLGGEDTTPSVACSVQNRLGACCPALDINSACSGFLFALDVAAGYFARGKVKRMLVIGAERMSRILDWTDRSTCVIFGDAAGAAVLGEGDGYLSSKLFSQGGDEVLKIPNYVGPSRFSNAKQMTPHIRMNGQETFRFAVTTMCQDLRDVILEAGLTEEDISFVVPHQANYRIIHAAEKRLQIPLERFYINIERFGNTSAASIPLALDEVNRNGRIKAGDYVAFCAFGGGLSSAACVVRW